VEYLEARHIRLPSVFILGTPRIPSTPHTR
jgi:hypothetical protein